METNVNPSTSLSIEPAAAAQQHLPPQPSGEFARVLQDQASPGEERNIERQKNKGEGFRPITDGEIPLALSALLPATLPIEGNTGDGKGTDVLQGGVQNFGDEGAQAQAFNGPERFNSHPVIPYLQGLGKKNSSSGPMDEQSEIGLPKREGFAFGNSLAKDASPSQGRPPSLLWEESQGSDWEGRFSYRSENSLIFPADSNSSATADLADFQTESLMNVKDLIASDTKSADPAQTANQKGEEVVGMSARQFDHSISANSSVEIHGEKAPASETAQKLEIHEQVGQKVIWSLNQREEKFRLSLEPPHLGSIYMEIQRDKEHIKASLWAENPNTKNILQTNHLSIQKIIESGGFSLESFNVFVEQDLGAFQQSRDRMTHPESSAPIPKPEIPSATAHGPSLSSLSSGGGTNLRKWVDLIV
jgi:hypothetical protein